MQLTQVSFSSQPRMPPSGVQAARKAAAASHTFSGPCLSLSPHVSILEAEEGLVGAESQEPCATFLQAPHNVVWPGHAATEGKSCAGQKCCIEEVAVAMESSKGCTG